MPVWIRGFAVSLSIFLLQWLVLGRLRLWGAYPDAVLLYIAWVALRQGRVTGMLMGFGLGFLMDVVYDTWGIHMFVKTLVGFAVGTFARRERENVLIQPTQAFLGGLLGALVHNGLVVVLLAVLFETKNTFLGTTLWAGSALYTAFIALLVALVARR